MSEADLKQWFASQQKRMEADMDSVRSTQSHPTARGDGSEESWLTMFSVSFLAATRPKRHL